MALKAAQSTSADSEATQQEILGAPDACRVVAAKEAAAANGGIATPRDSGPWT